MGGFGRVDVLVNNAGISHISPIEETTLVDWRRVLEVNLTGPFLMCRELGKKLLERGSGSIVNLSSVAGYWASRNGRRTTRASTDSQDSHEPSRRSGEDAACE